ncbi:ribonuclease HII [Pelotomaculum thermopropionicum SI]|uniref:Ribonuclease HII n=1 Tax=Pelotomaculum thermopropionicum (strain DSM 13744 / JCM 10971 / SI) TaxID=370438 RepID=RNH2_PELTS|nr:RecName: Full=Ribonuclease HII; Short=RNase HII [Pelotomaculum thermopropionicum SI]BAF59889.1 ribonuclease HII [Pelotomaculum thermopropionicum SI]
MVSGLTVAEIRKLAGSRAGLDEDFLRALACDKRAGVAEIYRRLKRDENKMAAEAERLQKLYIYENSLIAQGYSPVAGVDEAGRGPLAGPVVAAAVILPPVADLALAGLNDSKKLNPSKRAELAARIKKVALAWSAGISTVEEIFNENIHAASLTAMRRAVLKLKIRPAYLLVDGYRISRLELPQLALTGGDGLSASVAAASILAKVLRDRLMDFYHVQYPQYGFNRHKGYATPEHLAALERYGPCPLHRAGYRPVKNCGSRQKCEG